LEQKIHVIFRTKFDALFEANFEQIYQCSDAFIKQKYSKFFKFEKVAHFVGSLARL